MRSNNSRKFLQDHRKLPSRWSEESALSQRILIYCASLLEDILNEQKDLRKELKKYIAKKKRPVTSWQEHVSKVLRDGGTIQQASKTYRKGE